MKKPGWLKKQFGKIKEKKKKFFESNKTKIEKLKQLFITIIFYGILINYACLIFFKIPFKWYGFPAFGIAYYFIMEEFVTFFRKLKAKVTQ
jgi:hypothetical protein